MVDDITETVEKEKDISTQKETVQKEAVFTKIDRTKAENFLILLEEALVNVQEQKESMEIQNNTVKSLIDICNRQSTVLDNYQEQLVKTFGTVSERMQVLSEKIEVADGYKFYLEEQAKNSDLSKTVNLLQMQLNQEKIEFMNFIKTAQEKISSIKSYDTVFDEKTDKVINKILKDETEFKNNAEQQVDEASKNMMDSCINQISVMQNKADEMIRKYTEKCQNHLDTIKTQSINFLEQTKQTNEELVKKIPAIKENTKFKTKDLIVIATCIIAFFGNVIIKFI